MSRLGSSESNNAGDVSVDPLTSPEGKIRGTPRSDTSCDEEGDGGEGKWYGGCEGLPDNPLCLYREDTVTSNNTWMAPWYRGCHVQSHVLMFPCMPLEPVSSLSGQLQTLLYHHNYGLKGRIFHGAVCLTWRRNFRICRLSAQASRAPISKILLVYLI